MVEGKENEQQEAPAMTTRTTRILRMMLGSTEEDLLSKVESLEGIANNFQCVGTEN